MIVATAGHVDHGKTTLVQAMTGVDTDRLAEERRRGLTIDLGFAYADWQGRRLGFIDVPGHHRFIGNMLAGVAAIDVALLVVAADEGPMPQTREHLQILDLLGVEAAVVALTRCDLADAVTTQRNHAATLSMLAESRFAQAPLVPVCALDGTGLDDLRAALLAQAATAVLRPGAGFRLAVDRAFSVSGAGAVVTGTAHAGRVRTEDSLTLIPGGEEVRVRGLRALDRQQDEGHAGERLALNLSGIHHASIRRGQWLVAPALARPQARFDARLRTLPGVNLRSGQEVHVHHGATHAMGRITLLDGTPEAPRVHLAVREPLGVLHGDRFILRDSSGQHTLAGGVVLDPEPPGRGRRRPDRLAQLDALEQDDLDAIVRASLACTPLALDLDALAWKLNAETVTLARALPEARVDGQGGFILRDASAWEALQNLIVSTLERFHAGQPQLAGMGIDEVLAVLEPRPPAAVLRAALRDLIRDHRLARTATRFHLPEHRPRLDPADARQWERLRPHLAKQPKQPPVVHDLARELELDPEQLTTLFGRIAHTGALVRVARNRFLLPQAVTELAALTTEVAAAGAGSFDARSYRDAAGIGRNLTIDLLEYFDRSGLTRRLGDRRRVVADPEDIFGNASPRAG